MQLDRCDTMWLLPGCMQYGYEVSPLMSECISEKDSGLLVVTIAMLATRLSPVHQKDFEQLRRTDDVR